VKTATSKNEVIKIMNSRSVLVSISRQCAVALLASAIGLPVYAQQTQTGNDNQATPPSAAQQQQPSPEAQPSLNPPKEGFWGRVNPFARKKWVQKRLDPINDRLTELDEVNARNARDIKDVDERAQAGIKQAQSSADQANQTATTANSQAQAASTTAQQASGHVDQVNSTVNGIDQYHQISDLEVSFRRGTTTLSDDSKQQLDQLAAGLAGHEGYIVEMEGHSPAAGGAGLQSSERLNDAVKRYLVEEHQIPVYRLHAVALGNVQAASTTSGDQDSKPERVRTSSVHIRLMENSLAAQASASPQSAAGSAKVEQP
jgi:outer membrane protein OmpA-like peptidoglycan-associated protein